MTLRCRPREGGDPYAAAKRCGKAGDNRNLGGYGSPPSRGRQRLGSCPRGPSRPRCVPGRTRLQRLDIDHRDVIRMFIGHVSRLVVRRDHQPACTLPAKLGTSQELQVRQRVCVEGAVQSAVDQQRFLIRRDGNAVRDRRPAMAVLFFRGYVRELDLVDLRLGCKIQDRKSIGSTILGEYPLGRAVRI
jgi:hypothetical protein